MVEADGARPKVNGARSEGRTIGRGAQGARLGVTLFFSDLGLSDGVLNLGAVFPEAGKPVFVCTLDAHLLSGPENGVDGGALPSVYLKTFCTGLELRKRLTASRTRSDGCVVFLGSCGSVVSATP